MTSNTDTPGAIYRWIERKPLTEAVSWTSREKFWLITAACHYGTHDWKSVAQVVRNAGEQYRPKDWYTPKSCERQFKVLVSNLSKEVKSLPLVDMLQHIAEDLRNDYLRDANKSKDSLKTKYCNLFNVLNRVKQGNLSRNEVVSLYSQARRNEIEGKQYMEQLMTRQNASLASENSSSGLSEETIKWNTPSAPLLTSLLRSRNTIPANRTVTTIASLLQSPGGTSRTRSGKMLPLSSSLKITSAQGTPTLSKLLEAPANPYLSSPPQSTLKNKPSEIAGTDKLVGNISRKENSLSTSLNKVRVDNINTLGSFNQINKSDLSASKKQTPKSPVSSIKSGSKSNSNIVNLLSDSDNEEENCISPVQNTPSKEKKDSNIVSRIEPRATRSQTRAEGSFKQLNDVKISDGKKEKETLRQENGESQSTEAHHSIEDDLIDIDQIEVEPLTSAHDALTTQTPSKITRSSIQRSLVNTAAENLSTNKVKSKEISNQMLDEISTNFVINSSMKNVATEYKNVMVGRSRIESANISGCIVPIGGTASKETIILRKDGQSFPTPVNMLTTFDGKILKQKRIIDLKGTNIKCIDGKISFTNPVVLLKKPFNIKLASELKNKTDNIQLKNNDPKKTIRINNSSHNLIQLLDTNQSLSKDDVTIVDDVNINIDDRTVMKTKKLSSEESQNLPLTSVSSNDTTNVSVISKSPCVHLNEKKTKNDKTMFNVFGKPQTLLNVPSKKSGNQDIVPKNEVNSSISEPNNRFIKELDFDFDQAISQTSLSELYNGVEEIVEMHSFDNEELNSLIECGSLDNSETEEPQNVTSMDHGDTSVSESDSTIGAFDTFAQITGVPPKSSSSKDIKSKVKEPKIQPEGKDLEHDEGFVQSDEIDDEQSSSATSMTGIPLLQNSLTDVMSKIGSDQNLGLNESAETKKINNTPEIIELFSSSDEDENRQSKLPKQQSTNVSEENSIVSPIVAPNPEITQQTSYSALCVNKEENNTFNSSASMQIVKSNVVCVREEIPDRFDDRDPSLFTNETVINDETNQNNCIDVSAVLNSETNQENDLELSNSESKTKVLLINETIIVSKEIISKISNDKHHEALANISKEILLNEDVEKNEVDNDVEIIEVEQCKEFEAEVIKKANDVENKEFEAETIQNAKKNNVNLCKEIETENVKEFEMQIANEIITLKAEPLDINESEEIEFQMAEEIETGKANEIEEREDMKMLKAQEIEVTNTTVQEAQEIELQKSKDQIQRIKDNEIEQAREAKFLQDAEIKKPGEAEMLLINEENELRVQTGLTELFRSKECTALKCKDIFLQDLSQQNQNSKKKRENEKKLTNEADSKRKKEEIRKDIEGEMTKTEVNETIKETELKETENIEIKEKENKITTVKSAELKNMKEVEAKEAQSKKSKETESKMRIVEVHVQLQREELDDQSKKTNKPEESTHEAKKVNIEETEIKKSDTDTIKPKEQALKLNKSVEIEVKNVKEIDNKINTRTRGSKTEEKFKDSYLVSKNISNKSVPIVKSLGSAFSMDSPSNQQTKNLCDEYKSNDDINKCDKNLSSGEHTKCETSGKSRTRSSSSFKKNTSIDSMSTSLHKSNEKSEDIPKATVGVKTRNLASSHHDVPSSNIILQRNAEVSRRETLSKALSESNLGKQLTVPLVKISTNRKPYHAENFTQNSDNSLVKQPVASIVNSLSTPQKSFDANEKTEKPVPKKRGRKRRIDVQIANDSDQQNLQNDAIINTSISTSKDMEPLAKRTRRSIETRESKKETVVKSPDNMNTKEKCLKHIYKNISERNKCHLSLIEKEVVRDLPPETNIIVKSPIYLQDIKRRVNSGEMAKISDLQINLMMMSFNAIMINRSDNLVFDDASNFQSDIYGEYLAHQNAQNALNSIEKDGKNVYENINYSFKGFSGINFIECITIDDTNDGCCNNAGDVQNDNETKIHNRFTRSNKESSSDSESDRALPPKKRKRKYFYQNPNNDVDSDCYDSEFI